MANRLVKDTIYTSPTLAGIPYPYNIHFPWWLPLTDDWGCFNADTDVIKGTAYPKIAKVTTKEIEKIKQVFYENHLLFLWKEGDRIWGYFISFNNHNFSSSSSFDDAGNRVRHRRRTPEPPEKELQTYLEIKSLNYNSLLQNWSVLEQSGAKCVNPNPNPNPNPLEDGQKPSHHLSVMKKIKMTDDEWLIEIKKNPAYKGLDIDVIKGKMEAWCLTKGKKPTRARLLNWLNREERPLVKTQEPSRTVYHDPRKAEQRPKPEDMPSKDEIRELLKGIGKEVATSKPDLRSTQRVIKEYSPVNEGSADEKAKREKLLKQVKEVST